MVVIIVLHVDSMLHACVLANAKMSLLEEGMPWHCRFADSSEELNTAYGPVSPYLLGSPSQAR